MFDDKATDAGSVETASTGTARAKNSNRGSAGVAPDDIEVKPKVKSISFTSLFRYADATDWILMICGSLGGIASGVAMPLFSIVLGGLFDEINDPTKSAIDVVSTYALLFTWLGLGAMACSAAQVACFTIASERQTIRLRQVYLEAVLRQDISWFDTNNSGELSSKIAENTVVIREAMGEKLGALFNFGSMFLSGFAVGFYYSWELTLVIMAAAPLLGVGGAFLMRVMGDLTSEGLGAYATAGGIAEEAFGMIRTVASLGAEPRIEKKYAKELASAEQSGIRKAKLTGIGLGFTMGVYFGCYALAFWYGSVLVIGDRVQGALDFPYDPLNTINGTVCTVKSPAPLLCGAEIFNDETDVCACALCNCGCFDPAASCLAGGDVMLVFFAVVMGSFALGQASPSITAITSGRAAAGVVYAVIDRKPEVDAEGDKGAKPSSCTGFLSFQHVNFAYPSRPDALIFPDLNLEIASGTTVALVGGSGSGKSTVVSLIERFYDPLDGAILLDGVNLRDLNVSWLRSQIGLVGQEPTLFATTIAQNIAYGLGPGKSALREEVEKAAKMANAHDFIMGFPDGYDTDVGEKGGQLSGGQKQRIAIARSVIRDPTILLLDEATSALDNESERIVQAALDKLLQLKKRTTIVIAHRLSTVRDADKIVVMEKGQVVEQGPHDELVQIPHGQYAMLVAASERVKKVLGDQAGDLDAAEAEKLVREATSNGLGDDEVKDMLVRLASDGKLPSSPEAQDDKKEAEDDKDDTKQGGKSKKGKKKGKKDKKEELYKVPMSRVFEFSREEKWLYVPATICAAINGAQMPVFAVLFADIITIFYGVQSENLRNEAIRLAIMFVILAIAVFIANVGQTALFGFVGEKMTTRVRTKLFHKLLHKDVAYFDMEENSTGALTSRLASDAALVKAAMSDRIGLGVMNLTTGVLGLSIAFYRGWKLALVLLALFPIMGIAGALQFVAMSGFSREDSDALAKSSQLLSESISGVRTVSSFGIRENIVYLYKRMLDGPAALGVRKGIVGGLGFGFSQGVMFWTYAIAFYYGGFLIDSGEYTFNQMFAVFFAIIMCAMGMGQAAALAPDLAKGGVATSNVFKTLDSETKINSADPGGSKVDDVKGHLSFDNVMFTYPSRPDAQVFTGFTLDVAPGTTCALVGQSGSGKSTTIQLLERFYDPTSGSVKLDGVEINAFNINWYRSQLGLVSQEPNLFKGTIGENISYGTNKTNVSQDEIVAAAKSANAHDFIVAFPKGYDTQVGEAGTQLSGGQKQRIAIARALMRDPAVLLLDEATSALDNESERIVQEALDELMVKKKRTTIVIAHRLSTIKNADKIVVVDKGSIVEQGTHAQLMATGVYYPKLYKRQEKGGHDA